MSKRVLATGGTGYIGSHTVIELINAGYTVDIIDNLFNSKESVLDKIEEITGTRPGFFKVDLLDREKLENIFKENQYDSVIHFAGLKAVAESVEKPLDYYHNNLTGTINLLQIMQKYDVKEIIFSSSATVYGDQGQSEYNESMTTGISLTNPYGRTKYFIEEILKDLATSDPDFKVSILRYFNPIGAHPSGLIGEDPNGIPNNLMPIIMRVSEGKIKELQVYGDDYPTKDGTCRRDYIHVVDLAKGHLASLEKLENGVKIYNLGTGVPTSVKEMIVAFEEASGEKLPHVIAGRRAGDLAELYANAGKALEELGWKTELTVADAMRDTINYLKNHAA